MFFVDGVAARARGASDRCGSFLGVPRRATPQLLGHFFVPVGLFAR